MSLIQGSRLEVLVRAESSGAPVSGLDETNFQVKTWWPGLTEFHIASLEAGEVVEIGDGFYSIALSNVTSVLGELFLQFNSLSTAFDSVEKTFTVTPAPISSLLSPELCVISGNIIDLGGAPGKGSVIRFRPSVFPSEENGSIFTSDAVETTPDVLGNFSVALVRKQTATVEITKTGVRVQIEIPDQATANIIDLLPPLN